MCKLAIKMSQKNKISFFSTTDGANTQKTNLEINKKTFFNVSRGRQILVDDSSPIHTQTLKCRRYLRHTIQTNYFACKQHHNNNNNNSNKNSNKNLSVINKKKLKANIFFPRNLFRVKYN
jgi:hypothetical protein